MSDFTGKKKIVFVIGELTGGGTEKVLMDIMHSLDPAEYDISLVLFEKRGVYVSAIPSYAKVYDLRKKSRYDFPLLIIRLAGLLRRIKPDTVSSLQFYPNVVAVLARILSLMKINLLISEHGFLSSRLENARFKRIKSYFYGVLYNLANACIVTSEGVKEDLITSFNVSPDRIKTIYDPVNLEKINKVKDEPLDLPGIEAGKYILAAGRLTWEKAYPNLLRAYALISGDVEEKLLILGEGAEKKALVEIAGVLGIGEKTVFGGFQSNPYKFMKNASLFALSSVHESFSLVIVEAMASGAAVVSTDCPSGPGEIISDGVNGILVPTGDDKALAAAMLKVLKDRKLRAKLIENGKKRAEDFGIPKIMPYYETLFRAGPDQ